MRGATRRRGRVSTTRCGRASRGSRSASRDAVDRGDLYAAMNVRTGSSHYARLAADDPDASRRESTDALRSWSRRGFHLQHLLDLVTQTETDLYEGDGRAALDRMRTRWGDIEASQLLRMQMDRIIALDLFARAELAAARASAGAERAALVASAEKRARALEAEGMRWSSAMAAVLFASAADVRGDRTHASELFARAAAAFDAAEMKLHAAAARLRTADDDAKRRALAASHEENVRAPERFAAILAP
jgi:hypothetical protein